MNTSKKSKKIVVMTSRFPYPLEKGDKLRIYYQIKELSKHFEIHLISTPEKKVKEEYIQELSPYCKTIQVFPISSFQKILGAFWAILGSKPIQVGYFYHFSIHRKIKRFLNEIQPQHIYCQLVRASEYVKNYHHCPKTIDYMDAFSKGMERRAENTKFIKKWFFKSEFKRLLNYENSIFEYFENHTIISAQDRTYIFHKNKEKIHIIPNGIDESFFETNLPEKKDADLVFIGNMAYHPNILAARFIVEKILPKLPSTFKVKIAGSSPTREVLKLASNQVEITGFVEDIRLAYKSSRIFIAPMFLGSGLQNKLLESMALGVPCITTTLANNALKATPDKEILIANTADEFVEQIQRILKHPELVENLTKNAQLFIKNNYDWESVTLPLVRLMEERS